MEVARGMVNVYGKLSCSFQPAAVSGHHHQEEWLHPLLTFGNTPPSSEIRYGRFLRASVNPAGTKVVVGDHFGSVYYVDITNNTYCFFAQLKSCCTAVCITGTEESDVLLGTGNGTFLCYNSADRSKVAEFGDHDSGISHVSPDGDGSRAIACSEDTAVLYCLRNLVRLRRLENVKHVCLLKAFFLPVTDNVISCYRDGSVFLWDSTTWECAREWSVGDDKHGACLRTMDASADGKYLAAGGSAKLLWVWHLHEESSSYVHPFQMNIKQVAFVPPGDDDAKHPLCVLGCNGCLFVFCIEDRAVFRTVELRDDMMTTLCLSARAFAMVAVTSNGFVHYFDMGPLCRKTSECTNSDARPPSPPPKQESKPKDTTKCIETGYDGQMNFIAVLKSLDKFDDVALGQFRSILRIHGEYPRKYRYLIWQRLLQLPDNSEAFSILLRCAIAATKPVDGFSSFSIPNKRIGDTFRKTLSCLVLWCRRLQSIGYLPLFVYPFVKLFHPEPKTCFEMLATILNTLWHHGWFNHASDPPECVLDVVEHMLASRVPDLMQHYRNNAVTAEVFCWTMLKSAFSEVFIKDDWLKIWDNILSNPLCFLLCIVAAFSVVSKERLASLTTLDIKQFFESQNNVPASKVLEMSYELLDQWSGHGLFEGFKGNMIPLPKGLYPKLSDFPVGGANCPCAGTKPVTKFVSHDVTHTSVDQFRDGNGRLMLSAEANKILLRPGHRFHEVSDEDPPFSAMKRVLELRSMLAKGHS